MEGILCRGKVRKSREVEQILNLSLWKDKVKVVPGITGHEDQLGAWREKQ